MNEGTELLGALPVAIYTTDGEGRITYYNQAAADLWGHYPKLGSARWCGSWRLFWPDGRPMPHGECPMALTLKEGRPIRGLEAIAERPDGEKVPFLPYPTPLKDAAGQVTGAINLLIDISERKQSEIVSARLASIVASSDDAIISKTIDGRITSWNAAATRLFGYAADEMIGQPILRIIPPELHEDEARIIARLQRGERIDHYETVRVARDGRRIEISLTVSPLRDKSGRVVGASKVARDITERKRAEQLQRLLLDELNHRVKNTLATVQAIASQSLHHARSPSDFVPCFSGRVQALARAHDLLTQSKLQGADVMELVREQVLFGRAEDARITCSGPLLMVDASTAVHLALVLHELATNARKYGALSVPHGALSVEWETRMNHGHDLLLVWRESGGPQVSVPRQRGFGTTLIERTLKTHGGEAAIHYGSDGVTARIVLPLPPQAAATIAEHAAPPRSGAGPRLQNFGNARAEQAMKGKRVIIIEDEPLVSMDLESSLTAAGWEVVGTAGTLRDATALCTDAECDAALVDVNLGRHPVDELVVTLTKRNIPFAFVTGYDREALPHGFQVAIMLRKPFGHDELVAVVERLVSATPGVVQLRRKLV